MNSFVITIFIIICFITICIISYKVSSSSSVSSPSPQLTSDSCSGDWGPFGQCVAVDGSCQGVQTKQYIQSNPQDVGCPTIATQQCNLCQDITDINSLTTFFDTSDNRQFSSNDNAKVISQKSQYECADLCNKDSNCMAYGYYSPYFSSIMEGKGTCELYYDKLSQTGQPEWVNLRIGKKKRTE